MSLLTDAIPRQPALPRAILQLILGRFHCPSQPGATLPFLPAGDSDTPPRPPWGEGLTTPAAGSAAGRQLLTLSPFGDCISGKQPPPPWCAPFPEQPVPSDWPMSPLAPTQDSSEGPSGRQGSLCSWLRLSLRRAGHSSHSCVLLSLPFPRCSSWVCSLINLLQAKLHLGAASWEPYLQHSLQHS